jgi:hypothetical protein
VLAYCLRLRLDRRRASGLLLLLDANVLGEQFRQTTLACTEAPLLFREAIAISAAFTE